MGDENKFVAKDLPAHPGNSSAPPTAFHEQVVQQAFGPQAGARNQNPGGKPDPGVIADSLQMTPKKAVIDLDGTIHPCHVCDDANKPHKYTEFANLMREFERGERRDTRERAAAVADTAMAAASGDHKALENAARDAFQKMAGHPEKFKKYCTDLQAELKAEGIDVRFGENTIAFHKQGEPLAVELQLGAVQDNSTGKIGTSVRSQPYDWNTKLDVQGQDAEKIVNGFSAETRDRKTARELGRDWDEAFKNNDFTQVNKDMNAAFTEAYKRDGMAGVRKLEREINADTETNRCGVTAVEEDGKLRILNARKALPEENDLAKIMTPEQLKQVNMVKHPQYGYVHVMNEGESIAMDKSRDNSEPPTRPGPDMFEFPPLYASSGIRPTGKPGFTPQVINFPTDLVASTPTGIDLNLNPNRSLNVWNERLNLEQFKSVDKGIASAI